MNRTVEFYKLNPVDTPMVETDYYQWLSTNWSGNRIIDIISYLADRFGFIKGSESIGQKAVQTHHYIHDQYFINEVKRSVKDCYTCKHFHHVRGLCNHSHHWDDQLKPCFDQITGEINGKLWEPREEEYQPGKADQ